MLPALLVLRVRLALRAQTVLRQQFLSVRLPPVNLVLWLPLQIRVLLPPQSLILPFPVDLRARLVRQAQQVRQALRVPQVRLVPRVQQVLRAQTVRQLQFLSVRLPPVSLGLRRPLQIRAPLPPQSLILPFPADLQVQQVQLVPRARQVLQAQLVPRA